MGHPLTRGGPAGPAEEVAFSGGAVMGMSVVALVIAPLLAAMMRG